MVGMFNPYSPRIFSVKKNVDFYHSLAVVLKSLIHDNPINLSDGFSVRMGKDFTRVNELMTTPLSEAIRPQWVML